MTVRQMAVPHYPHISLLNKHVIECICICLLMGPFAVSQKAVPHSQADRVGTKRQWVNTSKLLIKLQIAL